MQTVNIRNWQRLGALYLRGEVQLSEIAKAAIIFSASGFFGDTKNVQDIGVNVLDNSQFNNALVYGVLLSIQKTDVELLSYSKLGQILSLHPQTCGKAVNRLINDGIISREDFGSSGSNYSIIKQQSYAQWIFQLTSALVSLWMDEDLHAEVAREVEHVQFQRGLQVLKQELRDKFYHPKGKE